MISAAPSSWWYRYAAVDGPSSTIAPPLHSSCACARGLRTRLYNIALPQPHALDPRKDRNSVNNLQRRVFQKREYAGTVCSPARRRGQGKDSRPGTECAYDDIAGCLSLEEHISDLSGVNRRSQAGNLISQRSYLVLSAPTLLARSALTPTAALARGRCPKPRRRRHPRSRSLWLHLPTAARRFPAYWFVRWTSGGT